MPRDADELRSSREVNAALCAALGITDLTNVVRVQLSLQGDRLPLLRVERRVVDAQGTALAVQHLRLMPVASDPVVHGGKAASKHKG